MGTLARRVPRFALPRPQGVGAASGLPAPATPGEGRVPGAGKGEREGREREGPFQDSRAETLFYIQVLNRIVRKAFSG